MSQSHYSYDCAESTFYTIRSESQHFHFNQVEAVYNTCILPIFLYSSRAVTKRDVLKIDDLNHWCLRKLLGMIWYHHVRKNEVRWTTPLAVVQARRFSPFSHIARMPDETEAKKILTALPPPWRTGGDYQDALMLHGCRSGIQ